MRVLMPVLGWFNVSLGILDFCTCIGSVLQNMLQIRCRKDSNSNLLKNVFRLSSTASPYLQKVAKSPYKPPTFSIFNPFIHLFKSSPIRFTCLWYRMNKNLFRLVPFTFFIVSDQKKRNKSESVIRGHRHKWKKIHYGWCNNKNVMHVKI